MTTEEITEEQENWAKQLKSLGTLSHEEIRESLIYEFEYPPTTVRAQMRRYYLMVKREDPKKAETLSIVFRHIKEDEKMGEADIVALCHILHNFMSGFVLYFRGKNYTKTSRPYDSANTVFVPVA